MRPQQQLIISNTYPFPVQSPYYPVTPIGPLATETRVSPSREGKGCETLGRLKLLPRRGAEWSHCLFSSRGSS